MLVWALDLEKGLKFFGMLRPSDQREGCVFSAEGFLGGLFILMALECICNRGVGERG